jgi:hypothetical protein
MKRRASHKQRRIRCRQYHNLRCLLQYTPLPSSTHVCRKHDYCDRSTGCVRRAECQPNQFRFRRHPSTAFTQPCPAPTSQPLHAANAYVSVSVCVPTTVCALLAPHLEPAAIHANAECQPDNISGVIPHTLDTHSHGQRRAQHSKQCTQTPHTPVLPIPTLSLTWLHFCDHEGDILPADYSCALLLRKITRIDSTARRDSSVVYMLHAAHSSSSASTAAGAAGTELSAAPPLTVSSEAEGS